MLVDRVLNALNHQDISTIPLILYEILLMSRNPKADANDLANVCKKDIAGSARLLRAANSIYYGRSLDQPKVNTLKEAIIRLGFKRAQEIMLSATLSPIMAAQGSVMDYSANGLWKHSIAVGIGNRLLYARAFGVDMSLDPYLAGLLHDIGIAIEHQTLFSQGFSDAAQKRYEGETELLTEEMKILGITHEDIGTAVARRWSFPNYLIEVIGHHHSLDPNRHQNHHLIHINRVSEWMCYFLNLGYCDFSRAYAEKLSESKQVLGLTEEDIKDASLHLKAEVQGYVGMNWFSPAQQQVA
jgi:putative nucleotidyltransferase with HDIG domain